MKPTWDDLLFGLFLDQSILTSLEDQARRALRNKWMYATNMPNYIDYIYTETLMAIKPEAVSIAGR
jgi:NitT/TauT family transport system substrate-binding protein